MFSNNFFRVAFFISLFIHGVILLQNPNNKFFPRDGFPKKIEVMYVNNPQKAKDLIQHKKTGKAMEEPFLKFPPVITASKKAPPQFITREVFNPQRRSLNKESFLIKPALTKPDIVAVKKRITLPSLDIDKSNNPTYISYYQIVREKIRRAAYQNYTRTETGEVYLTFIISSNGFIRDSRIEDDKSSNSAYLREIALRSVKDASPFPNFPKDLDYPQLSFNVVVSFEIE